VKANRAIVALMMMLPKTGNLSLALSHGIARLGGGPGRNPNMPEDDERQDAHQ
jgi:hypothetical protein